MRALATWQLAIVAVTAALCIGGMAANIWRLLGRRSSKIAVARPGSAAESGHYGAVVPEDASAFDGFSYRVTARFAGRSRVVVDGDSVVFCGPRAPVALYSLWIWLQGLLLAAVPVALVWAAVTLDWRLLVWSAGLAMLSALVMAIGAGIWPGLGEVPGLTDGHYPAVEMSRSSVRDVKVGKGWADGGLALVILPFTRTIDTQFAEGHAVSWWGPDERGHEVRYALHCYEPADARKLATLLEGRAE